MKDRIFLLWQNVIESYWFIPSLMIFGAWFIFGILLNIDARLPDESWILSLSWVHIGTITGARQLLVSIVGSLITVIGLLFSMTMVVFTLASSQYGPQVMRHFLGDRVTQVVLGTLVSTFIYCLLILRSIGSGGSENFIPHISITFSLLLTLISLGMLIYFIHHVSVRIQPQSLIKDLANDLSQSLIRLFPEKLGNESEIKDEGVDREALITLFQKEGLPVLSEKSGYIQAVANEDLMEYIRDQGLELWLSVMPGDFVVEGSRVGIVYPVPENPEDVSKALNEKILIGSQRSIHQDIKYAIERMVEIAVRALSPGINEPFVSLMCVDYLSASLNQLSQQVMPSSLRFDEDTKVRVITEEVEFKKILKTCFDQILHYGASNPMVKERILENLNKIESLTQSPQYQSDIKEYVQERDLKRR